MGNNPQSKKSSEEQRTNELEILAKAGKITEQLRLFQSEAQHKEQRNLFARILIYGHSNLLAQLKQFPRERQREIVRELKSIDYETTDLLYQNLIVKKMKEGNLKMAYQEYLGFVSKNRQQIQNGVKYNSVVNSGEEALSQKKVAILLFAGGESTRFKDKENNIIPKQLYVDGEDRKCLLEIALEKVEEIREKYEGIPFYLVHNERNHRQVKQILEKYPDLTAKKLLQHESPIVNLSGRLCLKSKENFEIITLPRGCGDLSNLSVKGTRLLQEMKQSGVEYVCTLGIENICANVCDPYLIGLLKQDSSASLSFKCTYPNNEGENLKRVVFNKTKKRLEATELETLLEIGDKNCESIIRRSPVWMNNLVFRLGHVQQYLERKKEEFSVQPVFTAKKMQCTYWNPIKESYDENQHCYFFERELNNLLLNEDLKPIGVMVEREHEFVPVISINEEWPWADAYNQYEYSQNNQKKKAKMENYQSVVRLNDIERSQM